MSGALAAAPAAALPPLPLSQIRFYVLGRVTLLRGPGHRLARAALAARNSRGTWLAAHAPPAREAWCRAGENRGRRPIVVKHALPDQRRIEDRLRKRYDELWQDVRRELARAEHERVHTPSL
jgi:hypothetical protein